MSYRNLVISAGKQSAAAAYDLAKFGDTQHILFADFNLELAVSSNEVIDAACERGIYFETRWE